MVERKFGSDDTNDNINITHYDSLIHNYSGAIVEWTILFNQLRCLHDIPIQRGIKSDERSGTKSYRYAIPRMLTIERS